MHTKHLLAGVASAASLGLTGVSVAHADPLSAPALGATLTANPSK